MYAKKESIYFTEIFLHITKNLAFHSRTKYIGIHYHFVQEVVEEGSVDLQKDSHKWKPSWCYDKVS